MAVNVTSVPAQIVVADAEILTDAPAAASITVTVKLQLALLSAASVTSKVLVVTPTGKVSPEAKPAVWAVVAPEQLSVPIGAV